MVEVASANGTHLVLCHCQRTITINSDKDAKWGIGNIGLLTSKSSLLVSMNIKAMRSLQDGTVASVKGLSLNLIVQSVMGGIVFLTRFIS